MDFSCNLHFSTSMSNVLAVLKKQSSISLRYSSKFGICGTNKIFFLICIATFSMKFSKGDVDEALNHVGNYEIADVYITKDFSIINDNNFKLLDKVFKN